jgi:ubiquinone biosynthesis protein Coq4
MDYSAAKREIHLHILLQVRFVDDEELAYVMTRYRQIHDFVHCLLGLGIRYYVTENHPWSLA